MSELSRRDLLRLSTAGVVGFSLSGWLERLAAHAVGDKNRRRSCILLWMNGGPSQMDTFDLKPGQENGGPYKEIETAVPGIRISEHLPGIAGHMKEMAIIRSMSTVEADHGRATYLMRTGHAPGTPIQYPTIGSLVSKELGDPEAELPNFVSIAPFRQFFPAAYGPGFLGPRFAPLIVGENVNQGRTMDVAQALRVKDLAPEKGVSTAQVDARIGILEDLEKDFLARRKSIAAQGHRTAYQRAVRLMRSEAAKAFEVDQEPEELRDAYGRNLFGQGCLIARRLVERHVPFIEVTLSSVPGQRDVPNWDTHIQNFENVKKLSEVLDPAWATLMTDLKQRGLLESTLIVWMGEFGRTPRINENTGRDHWASSWSTVLAGGGIAGGQVIGKTSADGMEIEDRPVAVPDLLSTICLALGIDYKNSNMSNLGRPIRIVDPNAKPIREILA